MSVVSPTPTRKKSNMFLSKSFHGIPYDLKGIPLKHCARILQESLKNASRIYVKGLEKKKWLEMTLSDR